MRKFLINLLIFCYEEIFKFFVVSCVICFFCVSVVLHSRRTKGHTTHCGSLCVCDCVCVLVVKKSLGVQMCLCIWQGQFVEAYQHHLPSCKGLHNEGSEFGATLESIPLQYRRGTSKKRAMRGVTNSVASSVCLYLPYQSRGFYIAPYQNQQTTAGNSPRPCFTW